MNNIDTISDLLQLSGSQYRIFDIGRRIDKLSKDLFTKIELHQQPYPFPSQGHAHLAIIFWQKGNTEPYLWFVKLPLDERGLLNQAARNHYIAIIIEALGNDLTGNPTEKQEELLKANPYHFTPAQYKLAALNSKISVELKQEPSRFYQPTLQYLLGKAGWTAWQNIGVQGLTDVAAKINEHKIQTLVTEAIPKLPSEVLQPLCSGLENEILPAELIEQFIQRHQSSLESSTSDHFILRALSSSCNHPYVLQYMTSLIDNPLIDEELVVLLAGRCWELFTNQVLLMTFIENINEHQDNELFNAIFSDLVSIPTIRPILLACIRDPKRSAELSTTIGHLFSAKSR